MVAVAELALKLVAALVRPVLTEVGGDLKGKCGDWDGQRDGVWACKGRGRRSVRAVAEPEMCPCGTPGVK